VLGTINSIFGVDVAGYASSAVDFLFSALPNRHTTAESATKAAHETTQSYFVCNFDTIQCTRRRSDRSVITSFFYIISIMSAVNFVFSRLFFNLGYTYGLLCTTIIFPILFKVHYEVNFSCNSFFFGAVPVCFVDDVVITLDQWTPTHIPWDSALVTGTRGADGLLPTGAVVNCASDPYGFTSGERSLFYVLERFAPSWRHYLSAFSVGSIIGNRASAEMAYYYKKPLAHEPYATCFYVTIANFIPVLVILVIIAVFLFAAIQLIVIVITNASRAIDDLVVLLGLMHAEAVMITQRKKEE
jgi:hypothetical protein